MVNFFQGVVSVVANGHVIVKLDNGTTILVPKSFLKSDAHTIKMGWNIAGKYKCEDGSKGPCATEIISIGPGGKGPGGKGRGGKGRGGKGRGGKGRGGGAKSGENQQHSHHSQQQHHQREHPQQQQYHKKGSPKSDAKVDFQQPQESFPYFQQDSKPFVLPCKKTESSHVSVKYASLHSHNDDKSGGGAKTADAKGFISVEEHTRILQEYTRILQELKDSQAQIKDLISYNNSVQSELEYLRSCFIVNQTSGQGF